MNPKPSEIPKLDSKDLADFTKLLKTGIYKELLHQQLISAAQLNILIRAQTQAP